MIVDMDEGWISAFDYWVSTGIPTGGYTKIKKHVSDRNIYPETVPTPRCEKKCLAGYPKTFKDDLLFGSHA